MRWTMPVEMQGPSSTKTSVWLSSVASTLPRLRKRVFRLITRSSRSESIGGLVTWLKFWRKKCESGRYWSLSTASGVSSPIEPTASLASSTIGERISSSSSSVAPAATWRRRRSAASNSRGSGPGPAIGSSSTTFCTHCS